MKLWCIVLAAAFAAGAFADDLATKSGTIYKNYTIDKATPYGLSIFHDDGGATIPYADLPDSLRAKYKEAEKNAPAEIARIEEARKQQETEAKQKAVLEKAKKILPDKKCVMVKVKVLQILKQRGGIVTWPEYLSLEGRTSIIWSDDENDATVFISGLNLDEVADTDILHLDKKNPQSNWVYCWRIGFQEIIKNEMPSQIKKYTVSEKEALEYYRQELLRQAEK